MSRLAKLTAMLLLALWVPVVSHCDLEHVPGLDFLACCDHPDTAPHEDDDCEGDACAVVESGFYKVENQPVFLYPPVLAMEVLPLLRQFVPAVSSRLEVGGSAPPELLRTWQFSQRTARSPRAPSFTS